MKVLPREGFMGFTCGSAAARELHSIHRSRRYREGGGLISRGPAARGVQRSQEGVVLSREGVIGFVGGGAAARGIHRTHSKRGLPPEGCIGFIDGGGTTRGIHMIHRWRGYQQRDS